MAIDRNAVKERLKDGLSVAKEKAAIMADSAKDKARDSWDVALEKAKDGGEKVNDLRNDLDKKIYNPLYEDSLLADDFNAPLIARILESNPHASKEACRGAVGFNNLIAKNYVLELVKGEYPEDKFKFYPTLTEPLYIRNPYIENMYIGLNSYFEYIKKARIAELEMIANKLGAKYVKITYKEAEKKFVSINAGGKEEYGGAIGKTKMRQTEKASIDVEQSSLREIEVASKREFVGHNNPVRPELVYFKDEDNILSLIESHLGDNPLTNMCFTIKYNRSTDLNLSVAAGIDAVLSKLKMEANASIKSEVEKENRMYLEYEIKF